MPTSNVPVAEAGERVADIMLRAPRTVSADTTVAEARRAFENPRERLLLVARGELFLGAVGRDALGPEVSGGTTLEELMERGATVGPDDPVADALALLESDESERLPVVEPDGRLVGLVCFNRRQRHFCVDAASSAQTTLPPGTKSTPH